MAPTGQRMPASVSRILLVEDSLAMAGLYRAQLEREGFAVDHAASIAEARRLCGRTTHDMALLDLALPDGDGLTLLDEWRAHGGGPGQVVVVTANGSIGSAVRAVRNGASDYLVKPVSRDRLVEAVRSVAPGRPNAGGGASECATGEPAWHGFVGGSEPMRRLQDAIRALARSKAPVFVTGESGTGKELCAEALHREGARRNRPFVAINCGAIPRELMESEIFGHVRGAFTGAVANRDGAASLADGGTLLLDEVCELELPLQAKLLRFLQTSLVQRVGSTIAARVDVRIVCASNREPLEEVRAGRMREDLYYRLHVLPLRVPPLRDRRDDILPIARHFLAQFGREEGKAFAAFDPAAEAALLSHPWPGNVRELQNAIRQAVVFNDGPVVARSMLPIAAEPSRAQVPPTTGCGSSEQARSLREIERQEIERAIETCGGSLTRAARILGVSPSTLYRKRAAWSATGGADR